MARGPDGAGAGAGFSLADRLFNAETIGQLAREHAGLPGFDADRFARAAQAGMAGRGLMARLDHIAACLAADLPRDFPAMADALEAGMPPPLDPGLRDGDFGHYIHAVPGILAAWQGLAHPDRALDLIHAATQRFSAEFAIRTFLNRWPERTMARLALWAEDENYHVRRLVSEGTRPRLPWGRAITLDPLAPLPLLDRLEGDPTRFVTRSVANHLNDLTRAHLPMVVDRLARWRDTGQQDPAEHAWMARHALRGAVKRGARPALDHLGYAAGAVAVDLRLDTPTVAAGRALSFVVSVSAPAALPVLVDYRIRFMAAGGKTRDKVFKLGTGEAGPGAPLVLSKSHRLRADATTYRLFPGAHRLTIQVNGADAARADFHVTL